jgi:hypothetical protein
MGPFPMRRDIASPNPNRGGSPPFFVAYLLFA